MQTSNELTKTEKALVLAALFRGGRPEDKYWTANTDQITTLSLYFTGDISSDDCKNRFERPTYMGGVYDSDGEITDEVNDRWKILIELTQKYPDLIVGSKNIVEAYPTYSACRLTERGIELALSLVDEFPRQPEFPQWPDKTLP